MSKARKYMMLTRISIPEIQEAGKNLNALMETPADTLLATNIVLTMLSEVKEEKTFRIEAINYDVHINLNNHKSYTLEYDPDKLKVGSIFIYMLQVLSKWNQNSDGAEWQYREDKSKKILFDILKPDEM